MDFKEHLKKYLTNEEIKKLLSSIEKEDEWKALLLNTKWISKNEIKKFWPNTIDHPILNDCLIYKKNSIEPGKHYFHNLGYYYISEPSAVLVSELLDIKENDIVLDMCAAPGGKTFLASLKAKNGLVISNDIDVERAKTLAKNVERLGLDNVIVTIQNFINNSYKYKEFFDKIILDAPCSGSAMFRKNERIKEDWTYNKVLKCQTIQKTLLKEALNMLKPGGSLIYSTCSFSYEENEEVILPYRNNPTFKIEMLPENKFFFRSKELKEAIHLFPYLYKGEGHFICKITKLGEAKPFEIKNKVCNFSKELQSKFYLNDRYQFTFKEYICSLPFIFDFTKFNALRVGVKCFNVYKEYEIDHHLIKIQKHPENGVKLNEEELLSYLKGNPIKKENIENGFVVLYFDKCPVGLGKALNGIIKNHYPKGLRIK